MLKPIVAAVAAAAVLLLFAPSPAVAQDMALNGNFELQDYGPWTIYGGNTGTSLVQDDVNNNGTATWCLERKPGTPDGNGGIQQDVLLVAGVTYQFDADIKYYAC